MMTIYDLQTSPSGLVFFVVTLSSMVAQRSHFPENMPPEDGFLSRADLPLFL